MYKVLEYISENGRFTLGVLMIYDLNETNFWGTPESVNLGNVRYKDEKYVMPALKITDIYNGEEDEYWDNDLYLIDTLYPWLQGKTENEEFDEIFGQDKNEVLHMFNAAIKEGWLKL